MSFPQYFDEAAVDRACELIRTDPQFRKSFEDTVKTEYYRVRELQAERRLAAEVAAGFVPDWPEWSRQMAGVPL